MIKKVKTIKKTPLSPCQMSNKINFLTKTYKTFKSKSRRSLKPLPTGKSLSSHLTKAATSINNAEYYVFNGNITLAREHFNYAFRNCVSLLVVVTHAENKNYLTRSNIMPAMFYVTKKSSNDEEKNYDTSFELTPGIGSLNFQSLSNNADVDLKDAKSVEKAGFTSPRSINFLYQLVILEMLIHSAYNYCLISLNAKNFSSSILTSRSVTDVLEKIPGMEDQIIKFNLILASAFINSRSVNVGLEVLRQLALPCNTNEKSAAGFLKTPASWEEENLKTFFKTGEFKKSEKSDENNFIVDADSDENKVEFSDKEISLILDKILKYTSTSRSAATTGNLQAQNCHKLKEILENVIPEFCQEFQKIDDQHLEQYVSKIDTCLLENTVIDINLINIISKIIPTLQFRTFNFKFLESFFDIEQVLSADKSCEKSSINIRTVSPSGNESVYKTPPRNASVSNLSLSSSMIGQGQGQESSSKMKTRGQAIATPKAPLRNLGTRSRSAITPAMRLRKQERENLRSGSVCVDSPIVNSKYNKQTGTDEENFASKFLKKTVDEKHFINYEIKIPILEKIHKNFNVILKFLYGLGEYGNIRVLTSVMAEYWFLKNTCSSQNQTQIISNSKDIENLIKLLDDQKFYSNSCSQKDIYADKDKGTNKNTPIFNFFKQKSYNSINLSIYDQTFDQEAVYLNLTKFNTYQPISINLKISRKSFNDMEKILYQNSTSLKITNKKDHWKARYDLEKECEEFMNEKMIENLVGYFKVWVRFSDLAS